MKAKHWKPKQLTLYNICIPLSSIHLIYSWYHIDPSGWLKGPQASSSYSNYATMNESTVAQARPWKVNAFPSHPLGCPMKLVKG